jgi:hypothetical protein
MILTILIIVNTVSALRWIFKQQYYKMYKKFNKISSTNSKIYLAFINKMLCDFQIVFSNIFTHQPLEKYIFLLLHLSSLTKTSPSFIFIIIVIISCRVLFMICFNIYLFMLLFCRCNWSYRCPVCAN